MHMVAGVDAGEVCASVTSYERLEYDHIRHTTPCALYRRSTDTWWRYCPHTGHLASTLATRLGHTTMLTSGPVYAVPSLHKAGLHALLDELVSIKLWCCAVAMHHGEAPFKRPSAPPSARLYSPIYPISREWCYISTSSDQMPPPSCSHLPPPSKHSHRGLGDMRVH